MGFTLPDEALEIDVSLEESKYDAYLTASKLFILQKYPFWAPGMMACVFKYVPKGKDPVQAPAYTDGLYIYISSSIMGKFLQFFYNLSGVSYEATDKFKAKIFAFIAMHEMFHCMFMHGERLREKDPMLWNIATDVVINTWLASILGYRIPGGIYFENVKKHHKNLEKMNEGQFIQWATAEKVYDLLEENIPKQTRPQVGKDIYGGGAGDLTDRDTTNKHGVGSGQDYSESEIERIWKEALGKIQQDANKQAGNTPGKMTEEIEDILDPQIDWRDVCRSLMNRAKVAREDYSWSYPSKRSHSLGVYMPAIKSYVPELFVGIDTSGSITSKEFTSYMSEVFSMAEMEGMRIRVVMVDTQVQYSKSVENQDELPRSVHGRGGTCFTPFFDELKKCREEYNEDPALAVIFTDGYNGDRTEMNHYPFDSTPVLWVVTSDEKAPNHGASVRYHVH